MTLQEAFDKAARGLKSQGFNRSVTSGNWCQYNGPDDRHCAVGWLIADVDLPAHMNGKNIGDLMDRHTDVSDRLKGISRPFLRDLQSCHDNAWRNNNGEIVDDPAVMRKSLEMFALRWELSSAVLDEET